MKKINVLIIGGGGREHALALGIKRSKQVDEVYVAPGNPGTALLGCHNIPLPPTRQNFDLLDDLIFRLNIQLVVVGPDNALADGIVDVLSLKGVRVFGPTQAAAQIESSKAYAKQLMKAAGIPTAKFEVFIDHKHALEYVRIRNGFVVIKADGLALGKGVRVCSSVLQAEKALHEFMVADILKGAGKTVVIEEKLEGEELSAHFLCDGIHIKAFPFVRDHKHLLAGNQGPMTGGMGVYGPIDVKPGLLEQIEKEIVFPLLRTLEERDMRFVGCLYPGLMLTKDGPKVLEFNARFGDPETQVYMRLLEDDVDFLDVLLACTEKRLDQVELRWKPEKCVCITLAAYGYPDDPRKGDVIGIDSSIANGQADPVIFHGGTRWDRNCLVTNGGRVLYVTKLVKGPDEIGWAYRPLRQGQIVFQNMQYRTDIGQTV